MNRDVRIYVEGALTERLIVRCTEQGARFGRIRRPKSRALLIETDPHSAAILLRLCRKYGLDCRVQHRGGLSALRARLRLRRTLAAGLLAALLLSFLFLSRIWLIDVRFTGACAELGRPSELRSALESAGIFPGLSASSLDCALLQKTLLAQTEGYSFIGVRIQGVCLMVEASPETPAPEVYHRAYARDLVAAQDGVILSITVHSGKACVQPGETVRAGQLLISGEEALSREETTSVSALGEVVARVWYEGTAQAPRQRLVTRRTGNSAVSAELRLMTLTLPVTDGAHFASEEIRTEILPIGGLFLPLEMIRETRFETAAALLAQDEAALSRSLEALARAEALSQLASADGRISDSWIRMESTDALLRVRAIYEIHTDIAVTREQLLEEDY